MTIHFNVTGPQRKELVQLIAHFTGEPAKYHGAPTFAYGVGSYEIDKNGSVTVDPNAAPETVERLMQMLYDNGFSGECEGTVEPETEPEATPAAVHDGLCISMPRSLFSDSALENLHHLIEAKGALIRKALGVSDLPILEEDDKVCFPWFNEAPTPDEVKAYDHFICKLCELARTQKRITAKEKEVENEKYAFRCFLLRLGFIGAEYKVERKILLRNLTGSSAFKSGAKAKEEEVCA